MQITVRVRRPEQKKLSTDLQYAVDQAIDNNFKIDIQDYATGNIERYDKVRIIRELFITKDREADTARLPRVRRC